MRTIRDDAIHAARAYPILAMTIATFLMGCDESTDADDDDGGGGGGPFVTEFYGYFIDDAVEGLQYQSGSRPMETTDEYGTFLVGLNESLTFWVDGIEIGVIDDPRTRITPAHPNFGTAAGNIARFLQSLDTTPGVPEIDLTGIDLPDTPINFVQSRDAFGADPAVQQAIAASVPAGATGTLISQSEASQALAAATVSIFTTEDFENLALYPVDPGPDNEPCFVTFNADGTGQNICQDDIDANPGAAAAAFSWVVEKSVAVAEFDFGSGVEERVTLQRLGSTGNRISVQITEECLTCDPDQEPAVTGGVQTLVTALTLSPSSISGTTLNLAGRGTTATVAFNANGTGSWTEGTVAETFVWALDTTINDLLVLRGTGTPGSSLLHHQLILLDGTVQRGSFAVVRARATDTDMSGVIEDAEIAATGTYESIAVHESS